MSICTRNQTMTGVKFLFRVILRRHDLEAEIFHLREPNRVPLVLVELKSAAASNYFVSESQMIFEGLLLADWEICSRLSRIVLNI